MNLGVQPRSQGLSSLPPLVVGIKTLVAAGHVTTCDINFSTGVESTSNFCRSELKRNKVDRWPSGIDTRANTPLKFSSFIPSFTQVKRIIMIYIYPAY